MELIKYDLEKAEKLTQTYKEPLTKINVDPSWTKYLLTTHPVEFITTIGRANGKLKTDIAPFATCLDTSYEPPYIQISCAAKQHVEHGQKPTRAKMNTYLNIKQNNMFIVNVPPKELLFADIYERWSDQLLDIIAKPYPRDKLEDKIVLANLTKVKPFVLRKHILYPPLIEQCLAHLECRVVDIHRPRGSDHYNITGKVVGTSYDKQIGGYLDEIRENLAIRVWHHFGSRVDNSTRRFIGFIKPTEIETQITFHLEKNK